MFVTLLAAIATFHFCLSFQSVILSFKQVQPFRLWKNDIISRSQLSHKSLIFELKSKPLDPLDAGAVANRPTPYSTRSKVIASNPAYIGLMLPSSRRRFVPKDTKQFIKNLQASLS
jgi:hypothetical protein